VYTLHWEVAAPVPPGSRRAVLWIALPQQRDEQRVSRLRVHTRWPWTTVEDPDFHNRVVRVTLESPPENVSVSLRARVARDAVLAPKPARLTGAMRALYTRPESRVTISKRVRRIANGIADSNRARYNYVLSHMTYDKSVPGWGFGDTERACEVGRGNCTDYHSLFLSLSRARGVPSVFEMGYTTRPEGETNRVGGYHCWAWFYNGAAWVPVDISEADQHPDRENFYFGHLDANRITFSRGRDIRLPGMAGPPLNYLGAGGYIEIDGKPGPDVTRTLTYTVRTVGNAPN